MADTAVTIAGARVSPIGSDQEKSNFGYNTRFRVLYSDIALGTGATDTVTMTLGATPAKWLIDKALVNISTAFAGTTAISIMVGTTSSTAALISATSIKTAGVLNECVGVPILTNTTGTAAVNLVATFTNSSSGSPSALTAGQLDIYLNIRDQAKLP